MGHLHANTESYDRCSRTISVAESKYSKNSKNKTSLKKKMKLNINTSLENETKETNYKGSKTNNNTTNEN